MNCISNSLLSLGRAVLTACNCRFIVLSIAHSSLYSSPDPICSSNLKDIEQTFNHTEEIMQTLQVILPLYYLGKIYSSCSINP